MIARVFAAALLVAGSAHAAPTVAGVLQRLDAASRGTHALAGEFTQTNKVKLFKQELRSRGRFLFEKPRRIRWEYLDPDPSTMVLDGDQATLKTPGAPPQKFDLARDAVMRAVFDQLLLWVGSSNLSGAAADYDLAAGGGDDAPTLTLTPKAGGAIARAFARIELRFDRDMLLKGIALVERNGDEKTITFTKMVRNPKLPADAFAP